MISEKDYKEMTKDLSKIKELIKNKKDIEILCKVIKTTPRIKNGNNDLPFTKDQKMQITEKLIEIATLCIDLTQLELDFAKDIKEKESKLQIEKIVIEGDYEEAMKQLENADIPEEVKEIARSEIRKHFKDSL